MIDLFIKIIEMFLLNSLIETFGMIIFFVSTEKISLDTKTFLSIILIISLVNAALYRLMPPGIFQIVYILFVILLLRKFTKVSMSKCTKTILKFVAFIAVIEITLTIILKYTIVDLRDIDYELIQLLYLSPIKIIEVLIIYLIKRKEGGVFMPKIFIGKKIKKRCK